MMSEISRIVGWIKEAQHMVFLGGAGVSTLSGIPDFRSHPEDGVDFETILSHDYFMRYPNEFYRFYRTRMVYPDAKPSIVHYTLAQWEKQGCLSAVITQNIDGLHQDAGSRHVIELHGTVRRNYCMHCGKSFSLEDILRTEDVPQCTCGGIVKPDVVLYGEPLPEDAWSDAVRVIRQSDLMIVAGTSLKVYPAAGLIHYLKSGRLILINRDSTDLDRYCDIVIHGELQEIFEILQTQTEVSQDRCC